MNFSYQHAHKRLINIFNGTRIEPICFSTLAIKKTNRKSRGISKKTELHNGTEDASYLFNRKDIIVAIQCCPSPA